MCLLQLSLSFDSPTVGAIGVLCLWIVLFFPFAIWATKIVRPDALNTIEAYILGQTCGPVGIYLIKRANERAVIKAQADELARRAPPPEPPEIMHAPAQPPAFLPGATAWRPPPEGPPPQSGPVPMDTWRP
ncbi:MAG: hypothetical protein IPK87_05545 [Planctomycetes bacterium]|nr:hypothetical protein [Planctomycetota bacterium]